MPFLDSPCTWLAKRPIAKTADHIVAFLLCYALGKHDWSWGEELPSCSSVRDCGWTAEIKIKPPKSAAWDASLVLATRRKGKAHHLASVPGYVSVTSKLMCCRRCCAVSKIGMVEYMALSSELVLINSDARYNTVRSSEDTTCTICFHEREESNRTSVPHKMEM